MRLLANPIVLRAMLLMFYAMVAFVLGLLVMRLLRKNIASDAQVGSGTTTLESMPLHVYHTVIQQLRQQQQESQSQSQSELQRLRANETLHQAVLANIPSGVLVFGTNALVKTSNPAAKQILGFASAVGMGAEDIFRGALAQAANDTEILGIADEIKAVLQQPTASRKIESEYETPDGKTKLLLITISPLHVETGILGVACVIEDRTALHFESSQKAIEHAAAQ